MMLVPTFSAINFGTGDKNVLAGQGWYDNVMRAHPLDKNIFYAGGVYMCKVTVDEAANTYATKPIAGGYGDITGQINKSVHVDMHDIIYKVNPTDPTQFRLIVTNDGGVYSTGYKTNPGETEGDWSATAKGSIAPSSTVQIKRKEKTHILQVHKIMVRIEVQLLLLQLLLIIPYC